MAGRRVHLLISGRVQGVSYRASARDEATSLGLVGWVRNLPSGEVEALAQGATAAVDRFIEWCRRGPGAARVERVAVTEHDGEHSLTAFEVRR